MQAIKNIVTDKNFWLGCAVGFTLGAMHHYFGLQPLKSRLHSCRVRRFLTVALILLCEADKNGAHAKYGGIL